MFFPKQADNKNKLKKVHSRKLKFVKKNYYYHVCDYNTFVVKSISVGYLFPRQLAAVHFFFLQNFKKTSKLFIPIFANRPITRKLKSVRMGKGKGKFKAGDKNYWVAPIVPGMRIFILQVNMALFKVIAFLNILISKLPIRVKIIKNYKNSV